MRVSQFESGITSSNGESVKFTVKAADGKTVDLEVPTANLGGIIAFLCGLAQFAERKIPVEKLATLRDAAKSYGHTITPLGVTIASSPEGAVLAVQIAQFSLGFPLTAEQASNLSAQLLAGISQAPTQSSVKH